MQILFIFFRMYRIVSLNIHNNGSIQINNLEVYLTSLQKKKKKKEENYAHVRFTAIFIKVK